MLQYHAISPASWAKVLLVIRVLTPEFHDEQDADEMDRLADLGFTFQPAHSPHAPGAPGRSTLVQETVWHECATLNDLLRLIDGTRCPCTLELPRPVEHEAVWFMTIRNREGQRSSADARARG